MTKSPSSPVCAMLSGNINKSHLTRVWIITYVLFPSLQETDLIDLFRLETCDSKKSALHFVASRFIFVHLSIICSLFEWTQIPGQQESGLCLQAPMNPFRFSKVKQAVFVSYQCISKSKITHTVTSYEIMLKQKCFGIHVLNNDSHVPDMTKYQYIFIASV